MNWRLLDKRVALQEHVLILVPALVLLRTPISVQLLKALPAVNY